jgi:hypothetical protein
MPVKPCEASIWQKPATLASAAINALPDEGKEHSGFCFSKIKSGISCLWFAYRQLVAAHIAGKRNQAKRLGVTVIVEGMEFIDPIKDGSRQVDSVCN